MTHSNEGWWRPYIYGTSKKHYIRNGESLCGKWIHTSGNLIQEPDDTPRHCEACKRKLRESKGSEQ